MKRETSMKKAAEVFVAQAFASVPTTARGPWPEPSGKAKSMLTKMHTKYSKVFDEMKKDAADLMKIARTETDHRAAQQIENLAKSMSRGMDPSQIQYDARTIYDIKY